jgi:predicted O-linked N-acetylglucosamine transferase (SPINDLY family)
MLRWLFKPAARTVPAPQQGSADRLVAEGNRAEREGRLREACELYRRAVAAAPGWGKAHLNLGIGLEASGATDDAIKSYEAALALEPAEAFANYNLGKLLYTLGRLPRAEQLLRQALRSRPEFPEAHIVLSRVLEAQGNPGAAAVALEVALKLRPDDIGALHHYAGVLGKLDRPDDAQAALKRVIALDPENADANYSLATLLLARGESDNAEPLLRRVVRRDPGSVEAHSRLFDIYHSRGDLPAAVAALERVLALRPDWADALYNYAITLMGLQRDSDAEAALRRVIALDAGFHNAYRLLGNILHRQGRVAEMLEICRGGRARHPERFDLESFELFLLNFADDISDDALFERHRAFGERLEAACRPRSGSPPERADAERRLRVGYVSGELNYHPVGLFALPVLERHDRSRFEVYCYATSEKSDDFTLRLSARADVWRNAAKLADAELAEAIQNDRIDILVDLAGHSGASRLGVFAQQAAPVQAAWLGYLNTTGLKRIRYRVTDGYCDPPGLTDRLHTETLVRLPHSQWCYRPFLSVPCAQTPPCMRSGHITFGSFNQIAKLSRSTRQIFAEVLNRLPDSRLVVLGVAEGAAEDELLKDFARAGIVAARITLVPFVAVQDYFRWFDAVDIALDTMPYSGGTTTCDALWMGVPVVTAPGSRPVSRSTASILTTVGLGEWIAAGKEEYVRRAADLAGKRDVLVEMRSSLRNRLLASPLMDEERFVRDLEKAYRQMWHQWCVSGGRGQ